VIRLHQISLLRGGHCLLSDCDLVVHSGQKLGLAGANGSGKSSLFSLLQGQLHVSSGDFSMAPGWRLAHMAQEITVLDCPALEYVIDGDVLLRQTEKKLAVAEKNKDDHKIAQLHAELDALDGYRARFRAEQLLHGLGFQQSQIHKSVRSFSGGWRMRLNLARTLMTPSDLLLLDEPTNHLDMDAIIWLEAWLKSYKGTLLLVSHDREFLDAVVDHIAHIEGEKINLYPGNYTAFERIRAERLAQGQALHEKQRKEQERLGRFVSRFRAKASKARQVQSRIRALERIQMHAPAYVDQPFSFAFPSADVGTAPLISVRSLCLGYPADSHQKSRPLLRDVALSILPGDSIGLLGANGTGKSTLIKFLAGQLDKLSGEEVRSGQLRIGYFAQHHPELLDLQADPILHVQRLSPDAREQSIRDFLGSFGFRNDKVHDRVELFSGGERARLALALMAWQRPNLLLLDEPTNHLDNAMRHALIQALQEFGGALVMVSHDRHLLRCTVNDLYHVHEEQLVPWQEDLDDYIRWQASKKRGAFPEKGEECSQPVTQEQAALTLPGVRENRQAHRRKAADAREKLRPLRHSLKQLEGQMDKTRASLDELEKKLANEDIYEPASKGVLLNLLDQQRILSQQMNELEEKWLEVSEKLESGKSSQGGSSHCQA